MKKTFERCPKCKRLISIFFMKLKFDISPPKKDRADQAEYATKKVLFHSVDGKNVCIDCYFDLWKEEFAASIAFVFGWKLAKSIKARNAMIKHYS